jgi:hypothetical protein
MKRGDTEGSDHVLFEDCLEELEKRTNLHRETWFQTELPAR